MQMLRLVLTFQFFFTLFIAEAQIAEPEAHLTFKGVPIDGTLEEYVAEMKEVGFHLESVENGLALFYGDFAAYKDCIIGVSTLDGKDLVSKVTVIFPEMTTWSDIESNYNNLKELLTIKYGEPDRFEEKFETIYIQGDDQGKMRALRTENCKYWSSFELKNGTIQLSMEHFNYPCVMLAYFDKINTEYIRQKALEDL